MDIGADPNITDNCKHSSLHSAIDGHCSIDNLKEIIDHGAYVNAVSKNGETPFLLACSSAQAASVKLLLKAKADPNITDDDGNTSLHSTISADCSNETLQEIIDHGADVNAMNKRGRTALLLGCFYRQMDSVRVLLEAGADPTIADEEGFSCLHTAVDGRCSKDFLQELIDHGAHIDAKRKDGTNAVLSACRTGQSESVRFLLEAGDDVNIVKPDGNTILHVAVHGNCSKETLQTIVEHGVNVNVLNNRCETALILACDTAQAESIKFLLENGADPNISDTEKYTCLHAAVVANSTNETLKTLITHKADLDTQSFSVRCTALMLACLSRRWDSIKNLLEAGSNPDIRDSLGNTSLHAAVVAGCSKKIIRAIIDHDAHINATNKFKRSALMLACMKDNKDVINVLFNAGADPNIPDATGATCLHYAAENIPCTEVYRELCSHGVDVNARNKTNATALMLACVKGNKDVINVLLNAGVDPNIADTNGDTCLHYTARNNCCTGGLQALMNYGADVNAVNKNHTTALMLACEECNKDALNVLLNAGADPNIADADGNVCLHYAARNDCCTEVLQGIISHGVDVNSTNIQNTTVLMTVC